MYLLTYCTCYTPKPIITYGLFRGTLGRVLDATFLTSMSSLSGIMWIPCKVLFSYCPSGVNPSFMFVLKIEVSKPPIGTLLIIVLG